MTAVQKKRPYKNAYMDQLDDPVPGQEQLQNTISPGEATSQPNPDPPAGNENPTNPEEATFKDRYGNLRRFHAAKMQEMQNKIDELSSKMDERNRELALPKTAEEVNAWRQKYPEIYDLVRTVARTEAQDERKMIDTELDKLKKREREFAKERALAQVLAVHPDFNTLRSNDDFHLWAQSQIPEIQSWLYENEDNAALAIRAVDLYKADRGYGKKKPEDKKKDEARASEMVTPSTNPNPSTNNNGKKVWKLSDIRRLSPREFEKYEEEIEAARMEGRIDYDVM